MQPNIFLGRRGSKLNVASEGGLAYQSEMRLNQVLEFRGGPQSQDYSVRNIEFSDSPKLLNLSNQITSNPLTAQLVGQFGVEHQETALGQHGDGACRGFRGVVDDRGQFVLARFQENRAGRDGAVLGDRPVTGLGGLDDLLDLLAQARAAARALTLSCCEMPKSAGETSAESSSVTDLRLSSSAMMDSNVPVRRWPSGTATVRPASGWRTRKLWALRNAEPDEQMARVRFMSVMRSSSCGNRDASGQSVRCTERPPVKPRQISSVTRGNRGAATRHTVSRQV